MQTVDFITAIGDGSPFVFGQIAAANSLSDVWAMGGQPVTAMALACFPSDKLDISVLREIILGAIDKLKEAETSLVGGHSVRDNELKFGLSITGTIHPEKVIKNSGAKPEEALILTKPLGTGIMVTANKGGLLDENSQKQVVSIMTRLNRSAASIMVDMNASACTDITGFGFAGHALEIAAASGVGIEIEVEKIPVIEGVVNFSRMGIVPGKLVDNLKYYECKIDGKFNKNEDWMSILNDPQTSGGLLISISPDRAQEMLDHIHNSGSTEAAIIGKTTKSRKGHIYLK